MAERVQQVKGPGARPPRGVKPQVESMKSLPNCEMLLRFYGTLHRCCHCDFCQRPGKCTGNDVYENAD